jgi:hypothetical protein
MACQVILSQKGPLPIKVTFNALTDGPVCLEVNGSAWSQSAGVYIGIAIQLDGASVGSAQIFSSAASIHRTVVPAFIPIKLGFGQHALILSAMPNTIADNGDFYVAVIHY